MKRQESSIEINRATILLITIKCHALKLFHFSVSLSLAFGKHELHFVYCVRHAHVPHVISCSVTLVNRLLGNML